MTCLPGQSGPPGTPPKWIGARTASPWSAALTAGAALHRSFMLCCEHGTEPHFNGAGPHPCSSTTHAASLAAGVMLTPGSAPRSAHPTAHGCSRWSRHPSRGPVPWECSPRDCHCGPGHRRCDPHRRGCRTRAGSGTCGALQQPQIHSQPGHEHACGVKEDTQPSNKGIRGHFLVMFFLDPVCGLGPKHVSTMTAIPAPNVLSRQPKPITFAHSLPTSR